jgi:hypothetical protein
MIPTVAGNPGVHLGVNITFRVMKSTHTDQKGNLSVHEPRCMKIALMTTMQSGSTTRTMYEFSSCMFYLLKL